MKDMKAEVELSAEGNVVYKGVVMQALVEQCSGCDRIGTFENHQYCVAYHSPESKWKKGHCNLATHVKLATSTVATKVNPLKAAKRAAKGR
ncbi:MAG: PxxKW family cysteine-rich protein [Desulfovibrionaceae bacterium]